VYGCICPDLLFRLPRPHAGRVPVEWAVRNADLNAISNAPGLWPPPMPGSCDAELLFFFGIIPRQEWKGYFKAKGIFCLIMWATGYSKVMNHLPS